VIEVLLPLRKGRVTLRTHRDILSNEGISSSLSLSLMDPTKGREDDSIWQPIKWGRAIDVGDRESLVFKNRVISTDFDN
jgi:hypothetical protein